MHSSLTLFFLSWGGAPLTAAISNGDTVTDMPSRSLTHVGKLLVSTRQTNRPPSGLATSMQYSIVTPGVDH